MHQAFTRPTESPPRGTCWLVLPIFCIFLRLTSQVCFTSCPGAFWSLLLVCTVSVDLGLMESEEGLKSPHRDLCMLPVLAERVEAELAYLEFVCIVEADLHRRDHPGLKQGPQDTMGHRVCDEVKVERIPPEERKEDVGERFLLGEESPPGGQIQGLVPP